MSRRHHIEDQITAEAWKNPQFKKELLENPRKALQQHLNITLPEGMDITVLEESPTHCYFVVPVNPASLTDQLSLEQLEAVSGGTDTSGVGGIDCSADTWQINCPT